MRLFKHTPKNAPDAADTAAPDPSVPKKSGATPRGENALSDSSSDHPHEKEGVQAAMVLTRKNPLFSRVMGPVGVAFLPLAKQTPHLIHTLVEHHHLHQKLDAAEKSLDESTITPDQGTDLVNNTVKLGTHARQKDIDAALKTLQNLGEMNAGSEPMLVDQYQKLLTRRDAALTTLGVTPPNSQDDWMPADKPTTGGPVAPFPVQPAHKMHELMDIGVDVGFKMTLPHPQMPIKSLEYIGFETPGKKRQMAYEVDFSERTKNMSAQDKYAYENNYIEQVKENWQHASHKDKALAVELLRQHNVTVNDDQLRLDNASRSLEGYFTNPYHPEQVIVSSKPKTFGQEVEDLETRAALAKSQHADVERRPYVDFNTYGNIEGPLPTPPRTGEAPKKSPDLSK